MEFNNSRDFLAARFNLGASVIAIVSLVGVSFLILVGTILASDLHFTNAGEFFTPFSCMLGALITINAFLYVAFPQKTRVIFFINMMIIKLTMSVIMMTLQYSMAIFKGYPLNDLIAKADQLIGFDWFKFAALVNAAPHMSDIVGWFYRNWLWEFVAIFGLFSYLGKFRDAYTFTFYYIVCGMGTILVSGFLDTKSFDAVAAYSIPGFHYPTGVSVAYLEKVQNLRQGIDSVMDFHSIIGLVAFPSFHAGAAVLMATATRDLKWLWLPFLVFNELILVGTITEGGHDFADVVGGCICVMAGIAATEAFRASSIASRMALAVDRTFGRRPQRVEAA